MMIPPPLRTLIDEPATVVPATIPLPQVIPPPARILSSASSSLPTTVPDTLKSAPPVTDPVNVDTPATDKPAPTINSLISCVPPRGTVPTRLPPIDILPPSIKSPSDILTVPINPPA